MWGFVFFLTFLWYFIYSESENDSDGEILNRICTGTDRRGSFKKRCIAMGGDEGVDDLDGVEFRETEIVSRENGFKPLYLVSEWEEPGTIVMRIPVAFLLPSAVGTGMFSMRVRDGGDIWSLL